MNKLFEKHETLFCILLIIVYVVVNSFCMQNFGYTSYISFIVDTIFSLCLILLIKHIVNLFSGAELIPTLVQICYSISIGYLFVIIFYKSKSLIPCIITHSLINSLAIFNVENTLSLFIEPIILIAISLLYAIYIDKKVKE